MDPRLRRAADRGWILDRVSTEQRVRPDAAAASRASPGNRRKAFVMGFGGIVVRDGASATAPSMKMLAVRLARTLFSLCVALLLVTACHRSEGTVAHVRLESLEPLRIAFNADSGKV